MTINRLLLFSCCLAILTIFSSPVMADEKEINCLAENIYYESESESPFGKEAIADLTVMRYLDKMYPGTFCKVVYDKKHGVQFSWVTMNKPAPKGAAWVESQRIAHKYYANRYKPENRFFRGQRVLFHHATWLPEKATKWFREHPELLPVMVIGNHVFYIYKEDMPKGFTMVASAK